MSALSDQPCVLAATPCFVREVVSDIRERAIFEAGKLDPNTFDRPTLAPFALRISPHSWQNLAALAEAAWAELALAEAELLSDPGKNLSMWRALRIPRRVRELLSERTGVGGGHVRFARIDFHPTAEGWRASEINSDVPGGFIEAGPLTGIVASHVPGTVAPPDPADYLAGRVASALRASNGCGHNSGCVALVHATSYTDDQQVMRCLSRRLESHGIEAVMAAPNHLSGDDPCTLTTTGQRVAGVLRFFPAEWLANLPRRGAWRTSWTRASMLHANPLEAALLQSKGLPLVLAERGIATPVWSECLPMVRAVWSRALLPQLVPEQWVLKPAWGRVGEGVCVRGSTSARKWRVATLQARFSPRHWILQRQFQSLAVKHEQGLVHPCLGVFVIDGRAAGVYARVSSDALIDGRAQDAAVLIDPSLSAHAASTASSAKELSHAA